jgi:hypothetical protein
MKNNEFMEYNTQREKLIIPEYGRNIQKMVDYCLTIQDRNERNAYADTIITAMSQVNPNGKEAPHYKQKLWDHLYIISDYRLDVDSPYPMPKREEKDAKPQPLKYKDSHITYRPYGVLLENMIKKAAEMPDGEEKDYLAQSLAQQLKKSYLQWNINSCDDEVIMEHFRILSNNKLHLPDNFQLRSTKELIGKPANKNSNSKTKTTNNKTNNKQKNNSNKNNKTK